MLVVVSYDPLYFCDVSCIFSFSISNFIDLSSHCFFLMSLDKHLSILFIFSEKQLLVSLIFSIVFFISISFISALIFMISFLLLTLGFVCSSFSSCFRCKLGYLRFFLFLLLVHFFLIFFYNCFTILFWFLPYIKMNQP